MGDLKHVGVLGMHWGVRRHTKPVYNGKGRDISAHPVKRIGKDFGQSDKKFDEEFDKEYKQLHKEASAEKRARAKQMVQNAIKNRAAAEALAKQSYAFRQMRFVDMKLGGDPNSSPAAVFTRNLVGQMVLLGVSIKLMDHFGI